MNHRMSCRTGWLVLAACLLLLHVASVHAEVRAHPVRMQRWLQEYAMREQVEFVPTASVVIANYELLKRGFPHLRTATNFEIDAWLINNFAFHSVSHIQLAGTSINSRITTNGMKKTAYRPPHYGRALVFPVEVAASLQQQVVQMQQLVASFNVNSNNNNNNNNNSNIPNKRRSRSNSNNISSNSNNNNNTNAVIPTASPKRRKSTGSSNSPSNSNSNNNTHKNSSYSDPLEFLLAESARVKRQMSQRTSLDNNNSSNSNSSSSNSESNNMSVDNNNNNNDSDSSDSSSDEEDNSNDNSNSNNSVMVIRRNIINNNNMQQENQDSSSDEEEDGEGEEEGGEHASTEVKNTNINNNNNNKKKKKSSNSYMNLSVNDDIWVYGDYDSEEDRRGTKAGWEDRFDELKKFHQLHGHIRVPREKRGLVSWMYAQRKTKGKLTAEQVKLLEDLGFTWEIQSRYATKKPDEITERWMERYNQLKDYFLKNGHSKVARSDANNRELYDWTTHQRSNKRKGAFLNTKQIELLNALQFPWEI